MESVLLVGNGVNRAEASDSYPSWNELLRSIGNDLFCDASEASSELLKYEQLICNALSIHPSRKVSNVVYDVARELDNVSVCTRSLHADLWRTGVDVVLTTNYDYAIERGLECVERCSSSERRVRLAQETYASKYRHTEILNRRIFHIHGELNYPDSICLGQVHYAVNLLRVMEALGEDAGDKDADVFQLRKSIFNSSTKIKTWAEYFFTRNVYIVGLGLYESDFDLWWLIAFRASQIKNKQLPNANRIIYFDMRQDGARSANVDILRSLNVEVLSRTVEGNKWKAAYSSCIDQIGEMIKHDSHRGFQQ